MLPEPTFFATPAKWRAWLEKNHAKRDELWVGFHKRGSGKPSITWPESVDEALCYGWIDGIRKSLGAESYMIRFTPRRPGSVWSAVNSRRVAALKKQGRMAPAGLKAFAGKVQSKSGIYAFEQDRKAARLTPQYEKLFRKNPGAWAHFQKWPDWYRRQSSWFVVSARKEETRLKRLERIMADAAAGLSVAQIRARAFPGA
jgi:uncharacterized protein YdeI (YjbR/CyaY-like superfamily)